MARGRPQRPHKPSWGGDPIVGLYHCPDGRWRINATGQKFTEPDERRAIARFRQWQAEQEGSRPPFLVQVAEVAAGDASGFTQALRKSVGLPVANRTSQGVGPAYFDPPPPATEGGPGPTYLTLEGDKLRFSRETDEVGFWSTVREFLIRDPLYAARMTGIPELASVMRMKIPQDAIKLGDLIDAYRRENPATAKAKREAIAAFERLIEHTQARTLDDLTQAKLISFRNQIENSPTLKAPSTRKAYYGRIRTIISFGLRVGLDEQQITAALARCAVLWTAEPLPAPEPKPIEPEHFRMLLKAAGTGPWRAWLLLGLNLCMSLEELCGLLWEEFDLKRGTYASIRKKTRRHRIPRAAVLWPEALTELRKLPRRATYVFVSTHGTRYNRNTRVNDFRELRTNAGILQDVTFSHIRDGAYTSACRSRIDDKFARVLAGHKAPGLQDNYVLRNPEIARPACRAVYEMYAPFPVASRRKSSTSRGRRGDRRRD